MDNTQGDENVYQNGRIIFIDPASANQEEWARKANVNLPPDYTNLSVSLNLFVTVSHRFKSDSESGRSNDDTYVLSWVQSGNRDEKGHLVLGKDGKPKGNWVSFMKGTNWGGNNEDEHNYLSTFYTDISYDDLYNNNRVEGLGIRDVSISFESFYTTKVTISFIDLRGYCIFAREQAIHQDGNLTAENPFGCFFTFPYPKFKLQIKGYYGQPVTYQLTCVRFTADFDSSSGNFIATATFMSYAYGLFSDISFKMLCCAPYESIYGRNYWNSHKDTQEWMLCNPQITGGNGQDTIPMVTIKDYVADCKTASAQYQQLYGNKGSAGGANSEESEQLNTNSKETSMLDDITNKLDHFESLFQSTIGGDKKYCLVGNGKKDGKEIEQVLVTRSDVNKDNLSVRFDKKMPGITDVFSAHDSLVKSIVAYNEQFPSNKINVENEMADEWSKSDVKVFKFSDSFTIGSNGKANGIRLKSGTKNHNSYSADTVEKMLSVNGINPVKSESDTGSNQVGVANKIATILTSNITGSSLTGDLNGKELLQYAYILEIGDLRDSVKTRLSINKGSTSSIKYSIDQNQLKIVTQILKFVPCIGNVFKMILAHLDTFLYIIYKTADQIYDDLGYGKRKASYLGVTANQTDVLRSGDADIPPFPGVFNAQKTGNTPDDQPAKDMNMPETYAWVGDFSHNFWEEKVVLSMANAFLLIDESQKGGQSQPVEVIGYPVAPWDYTFEGTVWTNVSVDSPSTLAGYLGIRAAQLFGILNGGNKVISDTIVEEMGRMDAYAFATEKGGMEAITQNILDKLSNTDAADAFISAAMCKATSIIKGTSTSTGDSYQNFEFSPKTIDPAYDKHGHQPVFTQENGKYKYTYIYTKGLNSMVPSRFYTYTGTSGNAYKPSYTPQDQAFLIPLQEGATYVGENFLHSGSISAIKGDQDIDNEKYTNPSMFSIITDGGKVSGIYQKIASLKIGKVGITNGKDDFSHYIATYLRGTSQVMAYFKNNSGAMLAKAGRAVRDYYNQWYGTSETAKNGVLWSNPLGYNTNIGAGWTNPKKDKAPWFRLWCDLSYKAFSVNMGDKYDFGNNTYLANSYIPSFDLHENNDYFNLFGHPFYYMQNKVEDNDPKEGNVRMYVKAFLFLNTLKYRTTPCLFALTNKNHGSLEFVPYGYVLFLGSLLWRKRYIENNKKDPIIYKEGSLSYRSPGLDSTFVEAAASWHKDAKSIADNASAIHRFALSPSSSSHIPQYIKVINFFGGNANLDYHYENTLIKQFKSFATNDFNIYRDKLEVRMGANGLPFTGTEFRNAVNNLANAITDDGPKNVNMVRTYFSDLIGGNTRYSYIYCPKGKGAMVMLIDDADDDFNAKLINLYASLVVICDASGKRMMKDDKYGQVFMSEAHTDLYIRTFANTLIKMKKTGANGKSENDPGLNLEPKNRDMVRSIYYNFKNLWDRWLNAIPEDTYKLESFFKKFYFIDTFYRNAYSHLMINVDALKDSYTSYYEKGDAGNLYEFMSAIIQKHQCLMFGLPDYVAFNGDDDKANKEAMRNIFRPVPYNAMKAPDVADNFVIMFCHQPSQQNSSFNSYKIDSFDVWSGAKDRKEVIPDNIPDTFKTPDDGTKASGGTVTRANKYGYNVPSFGVAFSTQNQSYFTDIKLNMDNPMNTDVSINALTDAISKGKDDEHKRAFVGQDLFNTFCNLSYTAQLRMMGDAQIQPMMYFQLLNLPMWRGTYMTYKVTHVMNENNHMFTEFQGIKLSRRANPWPSKFFTDMIPEQDQNGGDCGCGGGPSFALPAFGSAMPIGSAPDVYRNHLKGGPNMRGVNRQLLQIFNCLLAKSKEWGFTWVITSAARPNGRKTSDHYAGNAIDIQPCAMDNNGNAKPNEVWKGERGIQKALQVGSLAFSWYGNILKQVIVEYTNEVTLNVLHLAIGSSKHTFHAAYAQGEGTYTPSGVPDSFKETAKQFYANMSQDAFRKAFINYASSSSSQLTQIFGAAGSGGVGSGCTCPPQDGLSADSGAYATALFNGNPDEIPLLEYMAKQNNMNKQVVANWLQTFQNETGIPIPIFMILSFSESTCKASKIGSGGKACGLIMLQNDAMQAMSRYYKNDSNLAGCPWPTNPNVATDVAYTKRLASWIGNNFGRAMWLSIRHYQTEVKMGYINQSDMKSVWKIMAANWKPGDFKGKSASYCMQVMKSRNRYNCRNRSTVDSAYGTVAGGERQMQIIRQILQV